MPALKKLNERTFAGIQKESVFIEDKIHLTKGKNQSRFHVPKCSANSICGKVMIILTGGGNPGNGLKKIKTKYVDNVCRIWKNY